jgi:Holliday junction resolvase RusA-like endonuclease
MRAIDLPANCLGKDHSKQLKKARKQIAAMPDAKNRPLSFWLTLPPSVNSAYYTERAQEKGKAPRRGLSPDARRWKKEARDIAEMHALEAGWKMTRHSKVVVEITAYWPDDVVRRDMNNLHKLLADALERSIYWDDSMALLRDKDFHVDPRRPRVELMIYQLKENT